MVAYFPIDIDGKQRLLPFSAWAAGLSKSAPISFVMPVDDKLGLNFAVRTTDERHIQLSPSGEAKADAHLAAGTYIIAAHPRASWSACLFQADANPDAPLMMRTLNGIKPVDFDYVTLTIVHA